MKFKEIDIMLEVLENLKPKRVLEYGCGYSSVIFPKYLEAGASWQSIEHNKEWFEMIAKQCADAENTTIHHVEKNDLSSEGADGFKDYVAFPKELGQFDLILVDGVAREACVETCHDLLNDDGLLIVHDINRPSYQEPVKQFKNWLILQDFRKSSGGFGFASKDLEVSKLFDVDKHKRIWQVDSDLINFFKFKFVLGKKGKPFSLESSSD